MKTMNEPKAKRAKKQYDEAFRRQAVALVEGSGRPLQEIAAELGVTHWNLRDWTKKHGRNQTVRAATPAELQREMTRLRRENQSLQARCEVLKKALGILAEPSGNASHA
jgi:transposase